MLCDVSATDKQCVVRIGSSWISVAADMVREITIAAELVAVPQCHRALAGLCHLRSEFVPVIALDALLDIDGVSQSRQQPKLLVLGGHSVWALRISEAASIESLETLVAPESRMDDGSPTPIIGTAMFRDQIVRVLDPNIVFRLAQQALEEHWQSRNPSLRHAAQGAQR
jgi:chemotaxis signal transduction protein